MLEPTGVQTHDVRVIKRKSPDHNIPDHVGLLQNSRINMD